MVTMTPRTSLLEAVNTCLRNAGLRPVDSLEDAGLIDVAEAMACLQDKSRAIQEHGWHFNSKTLHLSPDTEGNIMLPEETLRADEVALYRQSLRQVGNQLYDVLNDTFTFTGQTCLSVVLFVQWDDLPEAARQFIMWSAAVQFANDQTAADTPTRMALSNLETAQRNFMNAESRSADYNMKNKPGLLSGLRRAIARRGRLH